MRQDALTLPGAPHALPAERVLAALESGPQGLIGAEASARLVQHGRNALPRPKPPGVFTVFLRQFLSPLIYILLFAAAVSLFLGDWSDAGFIAAVLLVNAVIGGVQEYGAEKSAEALRVLLVLKARVIRDGEDFEVEAEELVPGDVVLIESGMKVPADLRLLSSAALEADESLLTGESLPVAKDPDRVLDADATVGDRVNMAFAGTLVTRGRASGVVVSTGVRTLLGDIATSVATAGSAKPPLLVRMDRFTGRIALVIGIAVIFLGAASLARGSAARDVFFMAVALAVSAIPEGLPVALTVALSIGARRMSRRKVIARRLVAVEALGSCTLIASDKTGTLTLNEMTARKVLFARQGHWDVTGEGIVPEGEVLVPLLVDAVRGGALVERLAVAVSLCNDGFLGRRDGEWVSHGDAVDVALLVLAHKAGVTRPAVEARCPRLAEIPFEAERRFAATLHRCAGGNQAFVKGASERVLRMCDRMATVDGDVPIDMAALEEQANALAAGGYRVLVAASGTAGIRPGGEFSPESLAGLVFLGYVGMIDPLRPEARASMVACRQAGIEVAMVTGDHPVTALAIARELGFADRMDQVVTGPRLSAAAGQGESSVDDVIRGARVFARVEPQQKLEIVKSLMRLGHFVAVTGDGANDAPALRAANIGVAMGLRGTDIARETADLILTDDNFSSIAAGVEEGRIAYANVRKVIFLLISTGAAEVFLFFLAIVSGLPLPLLPVQLLWLNLVTNGIQDVALAFEPGEGGELRRPPRAPKEPIFDRLMIDRTLLSALVIGGVTFLVYRWMLNEGWDLSRARNGILLLMVLFENIQAGNSRSETRSVLRLSPLKNPILLFGTLIAQLVHIGALYTPGLREVLRVQPVTLGGWSVLLALALSLFGAMEGYKALRRARTR